MNLFGLSDEVLSLRDQAQADITPMFAQIDEIAEHNTQKVLSAFQKHRVAEHMFAGTTGYGYTMIPVGTRWRRFMRIFSIRKTPWSGFSLSTERMPLPARCSEICAPVMCSAM